MYNYKLTYEDACAISDAHKNFNFYKKEYFLEGYKIVVFNYFLCGYKNFDNPIEDKPGIKAFDMRGVTFVFNKDGSLYNKFLMLPKFFNINEVESTQYCVLKNKKIKNISVKDDGSLIAFMNLPNGSVFAKTLGGLDNMQSNSATRLYNTSMQLQKFVHEVLERNFTPMFEYVAFDNKIVLNYKEEQLRFIGLRDNTNNDFIPANRLDDISKNILDEAGINSVGCVEGLTIDDLNDICEKNEEIEGYVVEFEDGQLVKFKTKWYFSVHKLQTESINREDYVIENYLRGTLDDIMSRFDPEKDSNVFEFVEKVKLSTDKFIKDILVNISNLNKLYKSKYNSNLVEFCKNENRREYFSIAKNLIAGASYDDTIKSIKDVILKKTYRLNEARDMVEKYKNL